MILREFTLVLRRILSNKTVSIIKITGLTVGIICSVIAFLFVQNEIRYNKHFNDTNNVYRLTINNDRARNFHVGQPVIFFDEILKNVPEVENGCRLLYRSAIMKIEQNVFSEDNFLFVDSNFFDFYGWHLINGNPQDVLTKPYSLVISEKKSKELFGENDPIGRNILVDNSLNYFITGVFKDIPEQSDIRSDFLVSFMTIKDSNSDGYSNWGWHSTHLYFKLNRQADIQVVNTKIADLWNEKSQDLSCVGNGIKARLQPFSEIYLKSGYLSNSSDNLFYIYAFAVIAGFVLIISCFNFINLFIAVNLKGSVETGVKKVMGAERKTFAIQIMIEIVTYLFISFILSYILIQVLLPVLNTIINKNLVFFLTGNWQLVLFLFILFSIILLITGILPYLQMVYTSTAGALKGMPIFSSQSVSKILMQGGVRKTLFVTQFTIGIMLILAAFMINKQLSLIRNHDLGYNKNHVMVIDNSTGDAINRFKLLKDILKKNPEIENITTGNNVPSYGINNWGGAEVAGSTDQKAPYCGFISVTDNYFETIGAELSFGRFYDENKSSERDKIVINETLMKTLSLKDPIGTILTGMWNLGEKEIIGVVKNIEYHSLHYKDFPAVFLYKPNWAFYNYQFIILKLNSVNTAKTVYSIKKEWNKLSPDIPMNFFFLDELFDSTYRTETQLATLLNIMTAMAVLLCCLGLFGLTLFNINARTKEIGVRKVNGARIFEIIYAINRQFVILIIVAFLIAIPVASFFIMKWLENFAVKTSFPWWTVLLTGFAAILIAFVTVSWHSWRAATKNPVEALRYE